MYSIELNRQEGAVHIKSSGFWTEATLRNYMGDLTAAVDHRRRLINGVRIFMDARDAVPQSGDVVEQLATFYEGLLTPDDRFCVVVNSGLLKMQGGRMLDKPNFRIVTDLEAGRAWLAT